VYSIIDARRSQSNFQLIVITHEEEFVGMLARHIEGGGGGPGRAMGHYLRVSREETCVASSSV
jgi:DNA repair exonuclease SbcCD ATPase subunit